MESSPPILTIAIIIITVITSIQAFNNPSLKEKLLFRPYFIKRDKEWYRFLSSGFIHGDWMHLFVNMFVLYSFGDLVEDLFEYYFPGMGKILFLVLYILAIIVSSIPAYLKHHDHSYYGALGASGGTAAVLFASILLYPIGSVQFILIPIPISAPVFGVLYLVYSAYMAKRGMDNIGHEAHFAGAVFGFLLPILFKPELFTIFINLLLNGN